MAKRKLFSGLFWMGFSDGKPHIFTPDNGECVASVCKNRAHINYEDRRRVRIVEVKRKPRRRK